MADEMAQSVEGFGKGYVPDTEKVLYATPLINFNESYVMEFTAPEVEGDYPFVCTFPGHWRTMNGIMRVVSTEGQ